MSRSSRYVPILGLCAAACSGAIDDGAVAKQEAHGGGGGAGTTIATGPTGAMGSVGAGQGGTAPSGGGSNGQGGAQGPTGSAGATGGRASFPSDASDARGPADVGSSVVDAAVVDSGVTDVAYVDGDVVGPIVPADCAGDPIAGWTEYTDTFKIQRPYDLMESDRYNFANGLHTFTVFPTDKPFEVGNTTAPRTESRYTNFTTGEKMWTGDVLVDSPSNSTTIFQIHHNTTGAGPVYLQVNGGNVRELGGQLIVSGILDKWFNLKVAFEAATASATIYINNCQKLVLRNSRPGDRIFYFKNGVYTCTSSVCRDHYKNIHLYQR